MTTLVEEIVNTEWALFDKVQNIGGRASCQDDKPTFFLMRSSQLMAWTPAMQQSYLRDLREAQAQGRNPLSEKYGYMMERTSPAEFARIRHQLPARDPEKDRKIDRICAAHVAWLEALAAQYPRLAGQGRPIRRSGDSPFSTSFETYLWGELATYSMETITLYAEYVEHLQRQGRNLNAMVLQNTVTGYGYGSLAEAEARLSGR